MFSTVPGLDSPKAALRSERDVYVSARATVTALLYRNPKGESFSSAIVDMIDIVKVVAKKRLEGTEEAEGRDSGVKVGDGVGTRTVVTSRCT